MNKDFYTTPNPSRLIKLFWKAAGADQYILKRSTYSDHIKYACLGGIVVATGVMAAIAGGYAFYTIFEPKGNVINEIKTTAEITGGYQPTDIPTAIGSVIFGLIWGLIIFNIDRFIVTSTGKGDGTEAITKQELIGALPRIIMGTIIALTISKPVEIRMFKSEIDVELRAKQIQQQQTFKSNIDSIFNSELRKKEIPISRYEARIRELDSMSNLFKAYVAYETSHGDCKSKCEQFKRLLVENQEEANKIKANPEYIKVKEELKEIELDRKKKLLETDKQAAGLDGLLERLKIGHEIAGFWISTFITLLFMAIELTPIFFKLMLIKSPYDYMEENIKELIKAENAIQVQYNYYQDKEGLERHLVTYHNAKRLIDEKIKLIESQRKLSEQVIETWENQEKGKIKQDVSGYIRQDTSKNDA
jgi:hypothetical protein